MSSYDQFKRECAEEVAVQGEDTELYAATREWMNLANAKKYSYHFEWLGRPIIQYPQDIVAMQELIFKVQPDLILETGIAHGGSLIFYASMLELNAACGGPSNARVLGVDIDIRAHNRAAIEAHPMSKRVTMIQGSSIDPAIVDRVRAEASAHRRILVVLDSNHTREHALAELEAYAPLTSVGSYCVMFDTVIEDMPASLSAHRPWGPDNNPKQAVRDYLKTHPEFEIEAAVEHKLLITVAPGGFLRRTR